MTRRINKIRVNQKTLKNAQQKEMQEIILLLNEFSDKWTDALEDTGNDGYISELIDGLEDIEGRLKNTIG